MHASVCFVPLLTQDTMSTALLTFEVTLPSKVVQVQKFKKSVYQKYIYHVTILHDHACLKQSTFP